MLFCFIYIKHKKFILRMIANFSQNSFFLLWFFNKNCRNLISRSWSKYYYLFPIEKKTKFDSNGNKKLNIWNQIDLKHWNKGYIK